MQRFAPVFLSNLFLSLHYASALYANSTFLGSLFAPVTVSILFVLGALGNILLFLNLPRLLARLHTRTVFSVILVIDVLATLGMALALSPLVSALSFLVFSSTLPVIYYCLDIFLEGISLNKRTGETRGLYLTLTNLSIAMGPLVLILLGSGTFAPLYFTSLVLILPVFLITPFLPNSYWEEKGSARHIGLPLRAWWKAVNIRRITLSRLVLEVFFAVMVIFTPVYLYNFIGFNWSEIGLMFFIMLLPFVIFEWPLGELEDRFIGEKEILSLGFIITGFSLLVIPFLGKSLLWWTLILFLTRVGASWIEIASETYFFKHVGAHDASVITIHRMMRPVGVILGAGLGFLVVGLWSYQTLFLITSGVVLLGLTQALGLVDDK